MPSVKLILGLTAIATTLMAPGLGRAQTCTSDADCAKGLSCQADPIATPAVAVCYKGDGGGICTPVDGSPPVPTTSCQAAACATGADCGPTMVCNSQTTTSCTGGAPVSVKCDPTTTACDAGVVPDPVPVSCTDTVISRCIYKYELPCNADTDCGDNFTCQPTTYGMCQGSTGTASSGGGTASSGVGGGSGTGGAPTPAPLPPDVDAGAATPVTCTTVTSYPGSCQAKPMTCTVNADCPATWTCVTGMSTGTAVSSGPATAGSAPMAIDAGVPVAVPPPVTTTTSACQPPSTSGVYTSRGTTLGTDTKTATADAGTAQGSTTPPSAIVPTGNGSGAGQTAAATTGGGGCSVGGSASGAGWVLSVLGLLGLALARRRRV